MNDQMPLIPAAAPKGSVAAKHWEGVKAEKAAKLATESQVKDPEQLATGPLEAPERPAQPAKMPNTQSIQEADTEPVNDERHLSRPLRELADEHERLVALLVANDGELGEEAMEVWRSLNGETPEKLENCGLFLRNLETAEQMALGQVEVFNDEMIRLKKRAKSKTNEVKRLRRYIIDQMTRLERTKHEGEAVRLTVVDNQPKCDVIDKERVPDEFVNVSVVMSAAEWEMVKGAAEAVAKATFNDFTEFDVQRTVDLGAVIKRWKENQEVTQAPGTIVSRGNHLRVS